MSPSPLAVFCSFFPNVFFFFPGSSLFFFSQIVTLVLPLPLSTAPNLCFSQPTLGVFFFFKLVCNFRRTGSGVFFFFFFSPPRDPPLADKGRDLKLPQTFSPYFIVPKAVRTMFPLSSGSGSLLYGQLPPGPSPVSWLTTNLTCSSLAEGP